MENISVELIAQQMNLDRRYLTRLFKAKTGKTMQEYLIEVRLKQACEYLRQGFSVNHTASLCGYEDVSNFSRMFKKRYGLSPQHWQNKAKSAR
jgi:AraC-like DNA-binding protein